jgi:hypothetical protein
MRNEFIGLDEWIGISGPDEYVPPEKLSCDVCHEHGQRCGYCKQVDEFVGPILYPPEYYIARDNPKKYDDYDEEIDALPF